MSIVQHQSGIIIANSINCLNSSSTCIFTCYLLLIRFKFEPDVIINKMHRMQYLKIKLSQILLLNNHKLDFIKYQAQKNKSLILLTDLLIFFIKFVFCFDAIELLNFDLCIRLFSLRFIAKWKVQIDFEIFEN